MATGFWSGFRRFFKRGLAAILPTILTIAAIVWLFQKIHDYVGVHISGGAQRIAIWIYGSRPGVGMDTAAQTMRQTWSDYHLDVAGFVLAIVLIYIVGLFVASFIGRAMWRTMERLLMRLPIVRQIYAFVKPVTDFMFADRKLEFKRVLAVEYPRKGIWSVGLMTNSSLPALQGSAGPELITVFIPSSPTPFTGYTITIRRDETIDLPLTIEEALRFIVSGGVIMPPTATSGPVLSGPVPVARPRTDDARATTR